nr:LysR family transcriptional regulator [Limimaricola sp. G21655-S1]
MVRTFLEIVSTGSFSHAASRLNVAQTTVSARMKTLEEKLGETLLYRRKTRIELTPAGEKFLQGAPAFIQSGERLKRLMSVPAGNSAQLTMGGEVNLPESYLGRWAWRFRRDHPEIAVQIIRDRSELLAEQVSCGALDLAVMHLPPMLAGTKREAIFEDTLVMVAADPALKSVEDPRFVYVDWGEQFNQDFRLHFGDLRKAAVEFDAGPVALQYVLSSNGAAYGRLRTAQRFLDAGKLHLVPNMPRFSYPMYAVYSHDSDQALIKDALECLRLEVS